MTAASFEISVGVRAAGRAGAGSAPTSLSAGLDDTGGLWVKGSVRAGVGFGPGRRAPVSLGISVGSGAVVQGRVGIGLLSARSGAAVDSEGASAGTDGGVPCGLDSIGDGGFSASGGVIGGAAGCVCPPSSGSVGVADGGCSAGAITPTQSQVRPSAAIRQSQTGGASSAIAGATHSRKSPTVLAVASHPNAWRCLRVLMTRVWPVTRMICRYAF